MFTFLSGLSDLRYPAPLKENSWCAASAGGDGPGAGGYRRSLCRREAGAGAFCGRACRPATNGTKQVFDDLEVWLRGHLPKISGETPPAATIRYVLTRLPRARSYLDNGILDLDNNFAERAMKPVAIGRKNWTFAGSEGGGRAMANAYTLIDTA